MHTLQNSRVNVARHVAKICRNVAFYKCYIYDVAFVVEFFHHPNAPRNGDFFARWRRLNYCAKFLRISLDAVFDVFLEHGEKFVVVDYSFAFETNNQAVVFRTRNMSLFYKVSQQNLVIVLRDAPETRQRQHPRRKFAGGHFAARCECAHSLVVKQTVRHPVHSRRFHKTFFYIQLHYRNALQRVPRNQFGQHCAGFGVFLAHYKPHFGRLTAPPRASKSLQKSRHGKGCVDVKGAFKFADVDAEFEGCRGAD